MSARHGKRRHRASCNCPAKAACFTTRSAAEGALSSVPDAIRAYLGTCCGHWHITRYTQDEFAQRVAMYGVQDAAARGTVVPTTNNPHYFDYTQEPQDETPVPADLPGSEPRSREGRPGASPLERGTPRPVPQGSPADVARRLAARRGA